MSGFQTHGDLQLCHVAAAMRLRVKAIAPVGSGILLRTRGRRREQISEANGRVSHERGVAFDDNTLKPSDAPGNGVIIFRWYGARIEETAAVVELDLSGSDGFHVVPDVFFRTRSPVGCGTRPSQLRQRMINLGGNRADRDRFRE